VALVIGQMIVTVCCIRQINLQQTIIENGQRREIGLWLRDHAATPHDTVMLEPLGYIGYYSGLKMYDFPGLASREVVDARKQLGAAHQNLLFLVLKPDWIVLRPFEVEHGNFTQPDGLRDFYEPVKTFDATDKVNAVGWLPGRPYLQLDETYTIYHRMPSATPAPH
jgi:hypothetical protein